VPRRAKPKKIAPRIDTRYTLFTLRIGRSRIHRYGVFAAEPIPAHRKVIEYTGRRISRREMSKRHAGKAPQKTQRLNYLFALDRHWIINGASGGCGAEYINHSCNPNLRQKKFKGHILLMSGRKIQRGEELAYDYRFDRKSRRVRCACGARNCRGTINLERKQDWIYWRGKR
jgi:uncharacterized protein